MNEFRETAKIFKGKAIFVLVDTDIEDNRRVMDYFHLKEQYTPAIRLISISEEMKKYKPEFTEIKTEMMIKFVQDFFDKKIQAYLISELVPNDWDAQPVKILVGMNFDKIARNGTKNVLVQFCELIIINNFILY